MVKAAVTGTRYTALFQLHLSKLEVYIDKKSLCLLALQQEPLYREAAQQLQPAKASSREVSPLHL